ncbi:MAG: hypothetical protein HYV27_07660 [Candidatus Hydrogenedentes bacterium]|nr:hypothetical protein [Candidatus Hydrogenedentota bacterium]
MRRGLLVLAGLFAAGCAATPATFERGGVAYGVTEGPFRGRWWNYYERGRSFLDGGFFVEAEQDLGRALKERDEDQRWARTYGLHFVPQYFPNREYGVALYHLGNFQGAAAALETSYEQQPSARAACYLRLAQHALSKDDTERPRLDLSSANSEVPVSTSTLHFPITARDNTFIQSILVNGVELHVGAPAPELTASAAIALQPGLNPVRIAAVDAAGHTAEQQLEFFADFDGPALSFDEPVELPGRIAGVVYDRAGVTAVTIEGIDATLTPGANGELRFHADLDQQDLAPPLTFSAADTLKNRSEGTVPLSVLHVAKAPTGFLLAAAPTVIPFSGNLNALVQGGQIIAIAQASPAPATPSIRFVNLDNGQHYLMEEVIAEVELIAPAGIQSITLNGQPVDFIPERARQRVSRRIPLPEAGPVELVAAMEDASGNRHETRVTVERVLTEVESLAQKLSLAILGNIWEGPNRDHQAEETFISDELTRILFDQDRFDLVARNTLPQILTEQELAAAVGARNGASPLRDLVSAELFAVGMVRKDTDTIEIILQAINPENSQLMGYADVAGRADTKDQLRSLVADLALRFAQEFPRVQGQIIDARSTTRLYTSLSSDDRIRPNMKCIVFRRGPEIRDSATGTLMGAPADIIAEGWFDEVAKNLSRIFVPAQTEAGAPAIEVQDFVITK